MKWLNQLWAAATNKIGIAAPQDSEFKADLSLILHAPDPQKRSPLEPPYIRHYHKAEKDLYYITTTHECGIETDTFKTVKKAIEQYKPDIVVVEGLISSASKQYLQDYIKYAKRHEANGFTNACEAPYTALLAEKNNIPFIGGEPPHQFTSQELQKKGYSIKDQISFCLLRQFHFWEKEHLPTDEASVEKRAKDFLANDPNFDFVPAGERPTFEEFKAWYDTHNDKPERKFADFSQNDTGPMNTADASYFNRLSYAMGQIRDKNIVATIGDAIAKHKKVLVVYGSYHLFVAQPVFEKMFGEEGKIIQPMAQPSIDYRDDWSKQPQNQPGHVSAMTKGGVV